MKSTVEDTFLIMKGITKQFPGVLALDHVDFSLKKGEVHALVGENGAGKSTLMNILGGNYQPNEGSILLGGKKVEIHSPIESLRMGIGFVHQESSLLSNLTVLENVFLSREMESHLKLDKKAMRDKIREVGQKLGYDLDPEEKVGNLHLSEQQCVEITRALIDQPHILILDEPTAALDDAEVTKLFEIIRSLKEQGVSIIYISHRLDEIFELADRITVLKDGKVVAVRNVSEVNKDQVIALMVGRVLSDIYPNRSDIHIGEDILKVSHLEVYKKVHDVSFSVRKGEIVGLGGLEGQGQREIARAIFGDIPFVSGNITVNGTTFTGSGISKRIHNRIGYVTNDRRGDGLILSETVRQNSALASLFKRSKCGFINFGEEKKAIKENIKKMNIKVSGIDESVSKLSGGNQQKVMLSRWLLTDPALLIIDEPTKGVDVGARMSVYRIIDQLTREGIGILMITSDMMELVGLSDRVIVLYEGQITRELTHDEITEEKIMRAASGITYQGGD